MKFANKYKIGDCVCVYKFGKKYMPPRRVISKFGIIVAIDKVLNINRYEIFTEGTSVFVTSELMMEKICTK